MKGGQVGEDGEVGEAQVSCMGDSYLFDMEKDHITGDEEGLAGKKNISRKKKIWDKTISQRYLLGPQNGPKPWVSGCPELEGSGVQSPCGFREVPKSRQPHFSLSKGATLVPGIAAFSSTSQ